jgi:hypothetical protein
VIQTARKGGRFSLSIIKYVQIYNQTLYNLRVCNRNVCVDRRDTADREARTAQTPQSLRARIFIRERNLRLSYVPGEVDHYRFGEI